MGYIEIKLIVEDDSRVRVIKQGGAEGTGKFSLSTLHQDLIEVFDSWVQEKKITHRSEMKAFGSLLYESLFDSQVDSFFKNSLDGMEGSDRLRLQLVFRQDAFRLANIPWEFLYRPDREMSEGFFLATHSRLVLSRYLPLDEDREPLRIEESPLRFLVVVSKPKGLGPVLEYPVVEVIEKLCKDFGFEFDKLENPPIEEFVEKIDKTRPHILHFIGHGRYHPEQKRGEIALLKPDREQPEWVTDATFAGYFDNARPRLVVLHACEGAQIDFTSKFAGLAPQLIRRHIPAVVAMQYEVTNRTAIKFSQVFYKQLAEGKPVDGAVQEGRKQITISDPDAYSNRDFGTPVLYMHSRDGLIMPVSQPNMEHR